jgi:gamma-glutamyltranspeptidase/glutathione hydrolase
VHSALLLLCLGLLLAFPGAAAAGDRVTGRGFATRSEVIARHGMAATSQPLATQVALDVLRRGGNAVDAAIAANAALALMEPTGCGLGGDLFAMVWDQEGRRLHGLNASGRAPLGLDLPAMRERAGARIPAYGPLPVTVPGCVDGWFALHERFGRLPMAEVLAPAIRYAREGFPVSEVIAQAWARGAEVLGQHPGFAATFLPGGRAPAKGDLFHNPGLADTLEAITAGGREAFYGGPIAERIDAFCRREGCFLRKEDLAAHVSEWVEPLSTTFRGHEVWQLPPNGQGLAVLQMLDLLEAFDLETLDPSGPAYLHVLVEAKKLVYEDLARHYGDPAFADVPVARLLSKDYAAARRARIAPGRAARQVPPGGAEWRDGDTVYLATADADRNMVSLIQSNYRGFGSGLCPDGLGFCLQDRGALFTLEEGHPNAYAPGKRPFHTIIPGFVTRGGRPRLAFGVMGGDMQPQGHVQVLVNHLVFGMNLQEAGDAPRAYHTGSSAPEGGVMEDGGVLALESGIGEATRRELARRGHVLRDLPGAFGGYQAIAYDPERDIYVGASESRKDGQAAGW